MTGYMSENLIGQPVEVLVPIQYSHHKLKRENIFTTENNRNIGTGQDIYLVRKDGSQFPIEIGLSNVITDGKHIIVAIIQDITTRKLYEEKILYQANFDSLTNLPNRFYLTDRLTKMLQEAKENNNYVAVIFIDLDDFKKVNDSFGHMYGDLILIEVAQRLSGNTSDYDIIGHLGGDEFIVLLTLSSSPNLEPIVNNLTSKFKQSFKVKERDLTLTISIGIAVFPSDGTSAAQLIQQSETAMYHSKDAGRNTYTSFLDEMSQEVLRRVTVEEQLRNALKFNELEVYYQPKMDIISNQIMGAEALLRWNNQELEAVSPEEFIPVAEETGLIIDIGMFVFSEALSQTQKWHKDFSSTFSIAINLSPSQFKDTKLISSLKDKMKKYNVSPSSIELEITEGVLLTNSKQVDKAINELSRLGVNIAMDDFGTGYSSLSYLRRYPFDILKIDRSFINDLTNNSQDRELVNSAIAMAHGLNIKVVAEGVETKEQLDYLKVMSCNYGQGYLFSKPIPSSEMSALLKNKGNWQSEYNN
jgi:diguanylate cyclase (GGDEF)-like protein/PAS domain S-box-containing protein